MQKIILSLIFGISLVAVSGCNNLSPRLEEQIDNQNGKIDEIRSVQNGISTELGNLRAENTITDSELEALQQGWVNLNARLSSNDNSGIQILQGDGALIMVFSLSIAGMLLWHYRDKAKKSEKVSEILAQEIVGKKDPALEDKVFLAASHTNVESNVYHLMVKAQKKNN
jgi:predicted PurR-regulated permease PerM